MDIRMIKVIEKDLNMDIGVIRDLSWDELSSKIKKRKKNIFGFQPQHYFVPNGNIHMEQGKYMDTSIIDLCNSIGYLRYKVKKCLFKIISKN